MQKEIVQGIPFWRDKSNILYSFETDKKNSLNLGIYDPLKQTYILKEDWKNLYKTKLTDYRANLKNRERKENKQK